HQLRYLLAPSAELGRSHGYITGLMPPISVLALAAVLATLIRGTEGAASARVSLGRRIPLFALALLAIYASQESLEWLLAAEHPAGPAALVLGGGWIGVPLALAIGALAALLARALEAIERVIAVAHAERLPRPRAPAVRGRGLAAAGERLAAPPAAFGLARRPPPLPLA